MDKGSIALIVILLYLALTVAIGLVASARQKKKSASQSSEDFLMAGKSLGALALAGTHPIVAGLVLSGVVAATISSASGNMIGTATMFTNDLYVPYLSGGKADSKKEIRVSQIAMTVAGLFGLAVALSKSNIISVMMSAFALRSAGPFAAFTFGLFAEKVTERAGFYAILIGTVVAAVWIFVLNSPYGLSAIVPGGFIALIAIYVISKIDIANGAQPLPRLPMSDE